MCVWNDTTLNMYSDTNATSAEAKCNVLLLFFYIIITVYALPYLMFCLWSCGICLPGNDDTGGNNVARSEATGAVRDHSGSNDDGSNDDGSNDDGSNDDGSNDDGCNDDGSNDDGSNDDESSDDEACYDYDSTSMSDEEC